MKILRKALSLLCCFYYILYSQGNEYNLNLSKDNLSWYWLGRFNWESKWISRSQFRITEQFTSNLFLGSSYGNKWRDENNLSASWTRQLSASWRTASQLRSQTFSDENSFIKFSKHVLYQELHYLPHPQITFMPALGWTTEDIYKYRDQGWYSQVGMKINNYDLSGYINNSDGFSSFYFFPDRKNQEHRYFISFSKEFSSQAIDSLQVGYERVDNLYPLPPGSRDEGKILEDVGINSRYLYNDLRYRFSPATVFQVETKLQNRDITQSNPQLINHRQELNYANHLSVVYSGSRLTTYFAFNTAQITTLASRRSGPSAESRTDIDGLQAAFHLKMGWKISKSNETSLNFSYTKYEYSSPDTTQGIDEDDIRFITDLDYSHRFSPYFLLKLKGNLYLYHQIYIFPTRSANNNWNRIYQLASAFVHQVGDYFENVYQLKILANYTVYDFEQILPEVRSYLFRKMIFTDTLRITFGDGLKIQTLYQLEKEDNGTFFKEIFAQQISRELVSHYLDIALIYFRIKGLEISPAVNWYIRKEWNLMDQKKLVRDYLAFSPRISVSYAMGHHLNFYVSISPRVYRDLNLAQQYFTIGRLNLKYIF